MLKKFYEKNKVYCVAVGAAVIFTLGLIVGGNVERKNMEKQFEQEVAELNNQIDGIHFEYK